MSTHEPPTKSIQCSKWRGRVVPEGELFFLFFDIACRPVVINALLGVALTDASIVLLNRAYDVLYLAAQAPYNIESCIQHTLSLDDFTILQQTHCLARAV